MVETLAVIAVLCGVGSLTGMTAIPTTSQKPQRDCFVQIADCFNAKTNNGTDVNRAANLLACIKEVP